MSVARMFVGGPAHGRVIRIPDGRDGFGVLARNGDDPFDPACREVHYRAERVAWTRFTVSGVHVPANAWLVTSTIWTVFVTGPIEAIRLDVVVGMLRAEMVPPDRIIDREPTDVEFAIEWGRLVSMN